MKEITIIFTAFIIIIVVSFGVNSALKLGNTAVERKVFENSYQRTESLKSQIATDEAVIIEIEQKLMNPNLDEGTRYNLEAQLSAARLRINAAKGRQ